MKLSIINIGDEILNGTTINTNSAFLGKICTLHGLDVVSSYTVSDTKHGITSGIQAGFNDASIVLITGGLGPTKDDITKETLSEYFNSDMVFNEEIFARIKAYFEKRGKKQVDLNKKLAYIPQKAEIIQNDRGTAYGMWFTENDKVLVSMPGVPHELEYMFANFVLPKLKETFKMPVIINKYIMCAGIGESAIYEKIEDIENELPPYIKLAYLPNLGFVKLRLTYHHRERNETKENELEQFRDKIAARIKKHVYSFDDKINLAQALGNLLIDKKATLATAESCTGGYISHLITSNAGSSKYYEGSVIAYSYAIKEKELNVSAATLEKYGAVSEETVIEMVDGLLQKLNTTYGIAVSGIAGPGGGLPDKPVGTVWIAVGDKNSIIAKKFHLTKQRDYNIQITAHTALNMLRNFIKDSLE